MSGHGLPAGSGPLAASAETVIIGGGIMGLGIAYQLAKRGRSNVAVLESSYLASGASGRNGGGVRMQWSTEMNIQLMQQSIALCRDFASEMGINIWLRQGGYLFLARTPEERTRMERNVALQNRCGVPTRMLEPRELLRIVPELNLDGLLCGCFNPRDGVVFPWPFLWGYANRAVALGVKLHTYTKVVGIDPLPGGGFLVHTSKGNIRADRIINAAGAWSPQVAKLVGITLPNHPHRHEILSTEPLKPFLKPLVSLLLDRPLFLAVDARRDRRWHHGAGRLPRHSAGLAPFVSREDCGGAGGADAAPSRGQGRAPVGRSV
jgi:sarcosine oxidase subunit beta